MTSAARRQATGALRVVAHRGDRAHQPENTLAAFAAALRLGADEIECDVHASRDGVAVVCHDDDLRRVAGVDAKVADLTLAELRAIDVGGSHPGSGRHAIPTLDELLDGFLARIPLEVELKARAAIAPTIAALRARAGRGAFARVLITGFDREILVAARREEPRLAIGWLRSGDEPDAVAGALAIGCRCLLPHVANAGADLTAEAHRRGLAVRAWGVRDAARLAALVAAGADGCTSDDPGEAIAWLAAGGHRAHAAPLPPLASFAAS